MNLILAAVVFLAWVPGVLAAFVLDMSKNFELRKFKVVAMTVSFASFALMFLFAMATLGGSSVIYDMWRNLWTWQMGLILGDLLLASVLVAIFSEPSDSGVGESLAFVVFVAIAIAIAVLFLVAFAVAFWWGLSLVVNLFQILGAQ